MPALTELKAEVFCLEYMKDRNAAAAFARTGFSARTAAKNVTAYMVKHGCYERIAELTEELREKNRWKVADVLEHYMAVAVADRNELTSVEVGACRWCHGEGHAYQWRTEREFEAAVSRWAALSDAKRATVPIPLDDGGYGYSTRTAPHEHCPECDGRGEPFAVVRDTTKLSEAGKAIYAGMKQTQHGIEVKTLDAANAVDQIGRILGAYDKDNRQTHDVTDKLTDFLASLNKRGSKAALTAAARNKTDDGDNAAG